MRYPLHDYLVRHQVSNLFITKAKRSGKDFKAVPADKRRRFAGSVIISAHPILMAAVRDQTHLTVLQVPVKRTMFVLRILEQIAASLDMACWDSCTS